jgi:hypothetical protein
MPIHLLKSTNEKVFFTILIFHIDKIVIGGIIPDDLDKVFSSERGWWIKKNFDEFIGVAFFAGAKAGL